MKILIVILMFIPSVLFAGEMKFDNQSGWVVSIYVAPHSGDCRDSDSNEIRRRATLYVKDMPAKSDYVLEFDNYLIGSWWDLTIVIEGAWVGKDKQHWINWGGPVWVSECHAETFEHKSLIELLPPLKPGESA